MPFDAAEFRPPDRDPARRRGISDNALCWGIAVAAVLLLLLPISLNALVDIVTYAEAGLRDVPSQVPRL